MKLIKLLPLFVLVFNTAKAQTPETLLQKVQENYSTEKIYIHYDKSFYRAGETVWFKAYLMDGYLPSPKSTVFAVELLNDSGRMVDKKLLPITGSSAIGEFSLPKNIPQGNYTVKAYTRNLMNFGFQSFYYHHLNIFNAASAIAGQVNPASVYNINFFPEGGNLVGNLRNTVAFKCTDAYGNPKDVEGKILDAEGKEQATFKSTHDGMGILVFFPRPGEMYTAECLIAGTEKKSVALAAVAEQGVLLNIVRQQDKTFFYLDATTVQNENLLPDYILAVQENTVSFKVPVPAGKKLLNAEIPVSQLASGILQVTVFNKQNKPLAERLVFINSGDYEVKGNFNKDKIDFKARAKNSFSYQLEDTIAGTFSVSVTDIDGENKQDDNIFSHLLLTADIKGIVHNAAYYFESNDALHQQQLDLVMLTNGWRRYSWNELFADHFPSMAFKDQGFIGVAGQALAPSGKPLANANINVLVKTKDAKTDFLMVRTDSAGNFLIDGMTFEDTASFIFQNNFTRNGMVTTKLVSQNLSNIYYNLKTALPTLLYETPSEKLKLKFKDDDNFNRMAKFDGILMDEVKIKSIAKSEREKYEKKYVSGSMGSMANKTLDFLSEPTTSTQNIFPYLKSRLTGVNITGGPLNYSVVYRNSMTLSGGFTQMAIFLDEFQVDATQIATMTISQVAMVKVFASGGLAGGTGGALAIYTKKGDAGRGGGMIQHDEIMVEGFTPTKEFFSPNYSENNEANVLNDERTTLYWNPYLHTSAAEKSINFSFYNSDKAKKFKLVLEGMREDGKLLHIEKIIE